MTRTYKRHFLLGIAVCSVLAATLAFAAEDRGERQGPPGGRNGGRGGFDQAAMQDRMLDRMKDRLEASDEEWTIIKPRLKEVMTLTWNNSGMGSMRFMFGRGRRDNQPQQSENATDPVQKASEELQNALEKESPSAAEIKAKLAALRGAKEKNKQQLVTAQQKLKEVLTVKQEAMLVMIGMLE